MSILKGKTQIREKVLILVGLETVWQGVKVSYSRINLQRAIRDLLPPLLRTRFSKVAIRKILKL